MKKILYLIIPASIFLACCSPKIIYTQNGAYQEAPEQTDQVFYDQLSPYGQWIDYPDYGYVWQPNVDADFRPYDTNGNWVYSDAGWTWASNYSWGWAPFHYGRWFQDENYGWLWVPGNEWAPAWVTWGQSDNYYGWAAITPGADVNAGWRPRNQDWNYVPAANITYVNINRYVVHNNVTVINRTTIINNVTNNYTVNNTTVNNKTGHYNRGPQRVDVENITHTKIQPVRINGSSQPGQSLSNGQLNVYRPVIKQAPQAGNTKPAPQKVVNYTRGNGQNPGRQNPNGSNVQNQNPGNGQNNSRETINTQNPNQQPGKKEVGIQNSRQQNPTKPAMGQNPNKPFMSRPETVPPNSNQPRPPQVTKPANGQVHNPNQRPVNGQAINPNQKPANGQGNIQKPVQPKKPVVKKDTVKHPPKIMTPPPVKQQQ